MELDTKYLNISIKNDIEGEQIEREIQKYHQQQEAIEMKRKFASPQ